MAESETMESLGFVEGMESGSEARGVAEAGGVRRFYGKYRAVVASNIDPDNRCRLLLNVPDVYGPNISTWAMPCLPYAGKNMGSYIVPPPGAGVWAEFEQGDPEYPIWTGCWWGDRLDAPIAAKTTTPGVPIFLMTSLKQSMIALSDTPFLPSLKQGGVLLSAGPQSYIAVEPSGVTIVAPTINVTGLTSINKTALVVS